MSTVKISELNELTEIASADFIPIVDASDGTTKKVTNANFLNPVYSRISSEISTTSTAGQSLEIIVKNNWDSLPHGIPFMGKLVALGEQFVCGYIYSGGNYGSVMILGFSETKVIKRNNGTFSCGTITGTPI